MNDPITDKTTVSVQFYGSALVDVIDPDSDFDIQCEIENQLSGLDIFINDIEDWEVIPRSGSFHDVLA